MFIGSKDNHWPVPIEVFLNDHFLLHMHMLNHPKDNH